MNRTVAGRNVTVVSATATGTLTSVTSWGAACAGV